MKLLTRFCLSSRVVDVIERYVHSSEKDQEFGMISLFILFRSEGSRLYFENRRVRSLVVYETSVPYLSNILALYSDKLNFKIISVLCMIFLQIDYTLSAVEQYYIQYKNIDKIIKNPRRNVSFIYVYDL